MSQPTHKARKIHANSAAASSTMPAYDDENDDDDDDENDDDDDDEKEEEETWKDIPGEYSMYEASTLGHIRNKKTLRLLKLREEDGYLKVNLYVTTTADSGKKNQKHKRVHGLIALTFIGPLPSKKHSVNHKNGKKDDNRPENLEYATGKEQAQHVTATGLIKRFSRAVQQFNLTTGELIQEFPSIVKAAKDLKIPPERLSSALRNNRVTGGFRWAYVDTTRDDPIVNLPGEEWRPVVLEGGIITKYQISSLGRGQTQLGTLANLQVSDGYHVWNLAIQGAKKEVRVHQLVATAFLPPPPNDGKVYIVDHINEIRNDNNVLNLRWLTGPQNTQLVCNIPIHEYSLDHHWKTSWPSAAEATRFYGMTSSSHITYCCQGKQKTCHQSFWAYATEDNANKEDYPTPMDVENDAVLH